jgi:hypothetical protein
MLRAERAGQDLVFSAAQNTTTVMSVRGVLTCLSADDEHLRQPTART